MEDEFDFNVDPWEVYSFPTEQELLEKEEWERKEEERFYREWIDRDMDEHQTNYRTMENSIGMETDERRKLIIYQYLKYNYPRLVQNGIELTQNEIQSILEEHLREDMVILIQRFLLIQYRNDIDTMIGHELNLEINLIEIPVGEIILNYIDRFIRQKS
jgi:sugar diacid utilization regulator